MIKELASLLVVAVLITWAFIDFDSLVAVSGALGERFVDLVGQLASAAESRLT